MTRFETDPRIDTAAWSANNLPKPKTPPMLGFSVLAVAAGLVAIVLATAVSGPITTAGSKMEPTRFHSSAQPTGAAPKSIVVATTN